VSVSLAEPHGVAVGQPARGREGLGAREAEHDALLRQPVDPELVARVRPDHRQRQLARHLSGGAGVVDVRVGLQQHLERQAMALHRRQQARDLTARIDQRRLVGAVAPDERTVLLAPAW
jgi:hypothetical protein